MPSRPWRILSLWAPWIIVLFGLALRAHGVDATSLWLDEAYSWKQAARPFLDMVAATAQDNYPPLHNALLYLSMALFGDSEAALRLPSVLLGTGTIYLTHRLGQEMFGRRVGLVAALLLSLSVFHVWYSIEARMYALLGFTATLYVLALLRSRTTGRTGAHVLALVGGVLLLYSHVFGMFVFLSMNVAVLAHALWTRSLLTRDLAKWLGSQAVAGLLFLPWAYVLASRLPDADQTVGWIPEPSFGSLGLVASKFLGGPEMILAFLLVGLAGVLLPRMAPSVAPLEAPDGRTPEHYAFSLGLLACGIGGPFLIALAMSYLFTPLIVSRYLIGALPLFFVLVALLLTETFRRPGVLAAALATLAVPTLLQLGDLDHPDWRRDLESEYDAFASLAQEGDRVVFVPFLDPTFDYYVRNGARYDRTVGAETLADLGGLDRFWLVGSVQARSRLEGLLRRAEAAGFTEATRSEDPRMMLSLFVKTSPQTAKAP